MKVEVCLHVINDCGDKNVNYQWQRPGCWKQLPPGWLQLRGQYSNWDFRGFVLLCAVRRHHGHPYLSVPTMLEFLGAFKIWRGRVKKGERFRWLKTVWAVLSSIFDREGKDMRDCYSEGMFGSSDLQRSKSRPLTFVLRAASCSALIKLCKHPNHEATSAHINPTSFLLPICWLCNSAYYSFKGLSHNVFFFAPNDFKSKS